jgi:sialic acid synthase SpsE
MHRSIVVSKDLKIGVKLTKEDLDLKRPGTGLSPDKLNELIGKTIVRDVEEDQLLVEEDILNI